MKGNSHKILMLFLSLVLVIGTVTGCNKSAEVPAAQANTETQEIEETKEIKSVKIAYNPGLGNVLGFIAKEKGYDVEEGLNFEFVEFSNTTDALSALQAGKVEFGVSWGTSAPLILISKGADFGIIGGHENGGMPVYASQDFEYKGIESFLGKKVAVPRMYTPDIVWRAAMQTAGYDLTKDVEILEFKKPSEALEAVKSGNADIFVGTNSTYPQAMESGLKVIANSSDFWDPVHVGCRVVANNSWIAENEEMAKGFIKAYLKAEKVVKEDPEFAVKVQMESTGVEEKYARAQVLETEQFFQADPLTDGIIYNYERLLDLGFIEEDNIDMKNHLIVKYYGQALEELLQEYPNDDFYKNALEIFENNNTQMLSAQDK